MTEHTKGPWYVERPEHELVHAPRNYGNAHVLGAFPRICVWAKKLEGFYEEVGLVHGEVNARLIAAAPELLLNCKGALAALEVFTDKGPALDSLRTVIAKAEGDAD